MLMGRTHWMSCLNEMILEDRLFMKRSEISELFVSFSRMLLINWSKTKTTMIGDLCIPPLGPYLWKVHLVTRGKTWQFKSSSPTHHKSFLWRNNCSLRIIRNTFSFPFCHWALLFLNVIAIVQFGTIVSIAYRQYIHRWICNCALTHSHDGFWKSHLGHGVDPVRGLEVELGDGAGKPVPQISQISLIQMRRLCADEWLIFIKHTSW